MKGQGGGLKGKRVGAESAKGRERNGGRKVYCMIRGATVQDEGVQGFGCWGRILSVGVGQGRVQGEAECRG